jgi:hypothetical protein
MCDYSLVAVASRPARVADRLITAGFRITSTRGFANTEDINTAVCLRPGTEIAFDHRPKYHRLWRHTAASNVARFRQINLEVQRTHHDALEFSDGTVVPLTKMLPGQHATVLQLPSGTDDQRREVRPNTESYQYEDSPAAPRARSFL